MCAKNFIFLFFNGKWASNERLKDAGECDNKYRQMKPWINPSYLHFGQDLCRGLHFRISRKQKYNREAIA